MKDKKKKALIKAAPAGIVRFDTQAENIWDIINRNVQQQLKVGRPQLYTQESLWIKFIEYAQWNEANPLYEEKAFGTGLRMNVAKMRAMSVKRFCLFAGMGRTTFDEYRKEGHEFQGIAKQIEDCIFSQKLEGAAADLLNSSIISRELGLVDKQDVKTTFIVEQEDDTVE